MSEYAITRCPRLFGTHTMLDNLDVMMSRIGPAECHNAFNDMVENMRRVLPMRLSIYEYDEMAYQPDATCDPKLIKALKTWDSSEYAEDDDIELVFNEETMRLLLRQLCHVLFIGEGGQAGPDGLFAQFCHANVIYPGDRPYMVAGGLERSNDAPNDSYDAIMLVDATRAFNKSFTEDEIAAVLTTTP